MSNARRDWETQNILERFMTKVKKNKKGCWVWQRSTTDGYGMFYIFGKMYRAHRWMYEYTFGKIPKDKFIYHTCGDRGCVNPEHLFVGDKKDMYENRIKYGKGHKTR